LNYLKYLDSIHLFSGTLLHLQHIASGTLNQTETLPTFIESSQNLTEQNSSFEPRYLWLKSKSQTHGPETESQPTIQLIIKFNRSRIRVQGIESEDSSPNLCAFIMHFEKKQLYWFNNSHQLKNILLMCYKTMLCVSGPEILSGETKYTVHNDAPAVTALILLALFMNAYLELTRQFEVL